VKEVPIRGRRAGVIVALLLVLVRAVWRGLFEGLWIAALRARLRNAKRRT
jgi:hypothetical protein